MTKNNGLTLADLAAMHEDVPVGTSYVRVYAISAETALSVFIRFPKVAALLNGFDLPKFIEVAPDAVSAIIAAATGNAGDEQAEKDARNIGIETQYDILEAVGRLSFKAGFGPFVERLLTLAGDRARSFGHSGKVPDMKSPKASKPSSQPDTTPL